MKYDIRVVEDAVTGITQIAHVTYSDESGEVISVMQPPISEHVDLTSALSFIDAIYQASLKSVLVKYKEGDYE